MNSRIKEFLYQTLLEAAGVPDNIYETAVIVYDSLASKLPKKDKDDVLGEEGVKIRLKSQFRIADYDISSMDIQVKIHESPKVNEFELISMAIHNECEKTDEGNFNLKRLPTRKLELYIFFVAPENFEWESFIDFFKGDRKELIESLSHELKHGYDHFKGKSECSTKRAEYIAYAGKRFGIPAVDEFLHDLYFVTLSENLVRPTEIVSAIKNNEISQKDFIEFLKKQTTYITLKRILNFNLNQFKERLKKEMDYVNKFLNHLGVNTTNMTDDDKIGEILRLIFVNIQNWKVDAMKDILTTSVFEELLGFEGRKEKFFNKFVNRVTRFKNYNEFFDYETKMFHYIANKMIKKIGRVYSLINKPGK